MPLLPFGRQHEDRQRRLAAGCWRGHRKWRGSDSGGWQAELNILFIGQNPLHAAAACQINERRPHLAWRIALLLILILFLFTRLSQPDPDAPRFIPALTQPVGPFDDEKPAAPAAIASRTRRFIFSISSAVAARSDAASPMTKRRIAELIEAGRFGPVDIEETFDDAVDRAISEIDFSALADRGVYLDTRYIITALDLVEHIKDDTGLLGEFFRVSVRAVVLVWGLASRNVHRVLHPDSRQPGQLSGWHAAGLPLLQ
jgi:hypothetical protein